MSGGINSAITGGNIGLGALIGGISAGASMAAGSYIPGFTASGSGPGAYLQNTATRAALGGLIGGGVAASQGGQFMAGFQQGAMTSAIAYTANCASGQIRSFAGNVLNVLNAGVVGTGHVLLGVSNVTDKMSTGLIAAASFAPPGLVQAGLFESGSALGEVSLVTGTFGNYLLGDNDQAIRQGESYLLGRTNTVSGNLGSLLLTPPGGE